ncbi:SusC/RagA family TonB-linked outer membrane protein [Flavobacteriaceae bacterium F08102]|nr:SusC/RagA family TonB-linked outer membrane protein [Flavobacteriaceae bacterium F08102]
MKTFILLFCTSVFSFSAENLLSQNVKIKFETDRTLSIDEVFDVIKNQTDYTFIYRSDLFKNSPKISVKKGVIRANKLLGYTLSGYNLKFDISKNNTIVIEDDKQVIENRKLRQQPITGKVIDEYGEPMPGVAIILKGTTIGTTTDFDGNYSINAKSGDVLVVSFIGYNTQSIPVKNDMVINIAMTVDLNQLEEVVISTGYQKISKERATGSYETVAKAQLEKPSSSIAERLVGMVAGVQTTTNANGNIEFQIRGKSSLFADAQPLIVLDGFPIEGGFETINPNDVESITVLKDAAAASIWGAKSANGVIVIVTKKAKKGRTNVSISSFVKTSSKLDLDYVLSRANAAETMEYEQRAFDSDFFKGLIGGPPDVGRNYIRRPYSQAITAMNEARLGHITAAERDATLNRLRGLDNTSQIEDYLLAVPLTKQYNINISGGNEKMTNSLSLLFEDSNTYFQGDDSKKYLLNYSNSVSLAKPLRFDFGAMMQLNDITTNSGSNMLGTIRSLAPWDMLVNPDGSLTDMSYLNYYMPNFNAEVPRESFPYADWSYNPITEINNQDRNTKRINARVQAGLTLDILDGLKISSKIQYELIDTQVNNYYNENTFFVRKFVNEYSGPEWQDGGIPTQLVPSGGMLDQSKNSVTAYNFRNQLNFDKIFADKHQINFVAGTEISNRVFESTNFPRAFGYDRETLESSPILGDELSGQTWFKGRTNSSLLRGQYSFSENTVRFFSMYGNLGYTYNNKYTITGSYRTDASNVISEDPKYRYNPFWSVGFGWQLGKEDFMQDVNWVDRLTVRGTYGANGNIDRSTSFKPLINLGSAVDNVTGENTATISSYGNPTLRWEKTYSTNVGIDFSLFNRGLYGTIDVYHKNGIDLIVDQSISAVNGTTSQKFNNGEMVNKGVEVTLGTVLPIKGDDIVWSGSLNYAHNDNKITSFFKSSYQSYDLYGGPTRSYVEGENANSLWSYVYTGLTNVGSDANPVLVPSVQGDNGTQSPILTWVPGEARNYMENQGTTVAPTILGMRNSFKIYNFDLSFILTAKFGHVFRRQSFNYSAVTGGNTMVNSAYREVANSDPSEMIPIPDEQPRYYFYDRFYPYMSYLTEDAGHIRFQEINLNYSLPAKITNKLGVNSLNIFAQANNVGTILFNDYGEDPEFPKQSIKPQTSLTFGIQLNF